MGDSETDSLFKFVQGDVAVLVVSGKRDEFNLGFKLGDKVHSGACLVKRFGDIHSSKCYNRTFSLFHLDNWF